MFLQCNCNQESIEKPLKEKPKTEIEIEIEIRNRNCCSSSSTRPLLLKDLPILEPSKPIEIKITRKVKTIKTFSKDVRLIVIVFIKSKKAKTNKIYQIGLMIMSVVRKSRKPYFCSLNSVIQKGLSNTKFNSGLLFSHRLFTKFFL